MAVFRLLNQQRSIFRKTLSTVPALTFPIGWLAPTTVTQQIKYNHYGTKTQYHCRQSHAHAVTKQEQAVSRPPRDKIDLTFNDARQAFRSKSTWEILRAYLVFKLCSIDFIVQHNQRIMNITQKIMGKKLFEKCMEASFYGHFVAGADQISIQPKIKRLREFGVKAILDYSVEEDISEDEALKAEIESCTPVGGDQPAAEEELEKYHVHEEFADRRLKSKDRTYFYKNETQCDRNMNIFLQSIEAVSGATQGTGFAAIKITALGRPQLLMHLSEAIARVHRYVGAITGRKGHIVEQNAKPEDLIRRLERASRLDPTVQSWLDNMTYDSSGLIHILPWKGLVEAQKGMKETLQVPDMSTGKLQNLVPPLTQQEEEMCKNMMNRLHTIFKVATKLDVRVMVDAEQTYFQPAISRLTMEMMRKYNTEKAIVYNTYQCYLKKAYSYYTADLAQAKRQNFYFGAKLVRGAYMEQERERALAIGYDDPINPTLEDTAEMYHKCIEEGMRKIKLGREDGGEANRQRPKITLMAATHNEETVKFVINKMKEHGIKRSDRAISFGQLYGMCDQVSFPLGQSGYSVYKYVPYGPVTEVLPYLSRRAQENRGFVAKTQKEIKLLRKELLRRMLKGQFFYRPKGYYQVI